MQNIDIDLAPLEPGLAGPDYSAIGQVSMGRAAPGFSSYFSNVRKLFMCVSDPPSVATIRLSSLRISNMLLLVLSK